MGQRPSKGASPNRPRTLPRSLLSPSAPRKDAKDDAVVLKLNYAEVRDMAEARRSARFPACSLRPCRPTSNGVDTRDAV